MVLSGSKPLMIGVMLPFSVRKILDDISAEADIDDLCTLADAKNRLSFLCKSPAQRKLRHIKLMIDVPRSVHFLMKENRINVITARQNQCVVFLDTLRNFAGVDTFRAEVRHGLDVVGCVKICNQNLHIRNLLFYNETRYPFNKVYRY